MQLQQTTSIILKESCEEITLLLKGTFVNVCFGMAGQAMTGSPSAINFFAWAVFNCILFFYTPHHLMNFILLKKVRLNDHNPMFFLKCSRAFSELFFSFIVSLGVRLALNPYFVALDRYNFINPTKQPLFLVILTLG